MANEPQIQFEGNVAFDATLGETRNGKKVVTLRVLVTPFTRPDGGDRQDGETQGYDVEAYGDMAENVVTSLPQGTRVIVRGRVRQIGTYPKKDGTIVPKVVVIADAIGPDLRWATAQATKASRGGQQQAPQQQASGWATQPAGGDVWGP
jgi:single-strand DNA-binding protein